MQAAPADDEAGSDEFLGLAVVCAAFVGERYLNPILFGGARGCILES
jgi:hypothetical protein